MPAKVTDLRPALTDLSVLAVRDVRIRKCLEAGKILLRFKVYGKFAPSVFDGCEVRLVTVESILTGSIKLQPSERPRSMEFVFEFLAREPAQLKELYFSEDMIQWCNVSGIFFELGGWEYLQLNPFYRADPYVHTD